MRNSPVNLALRLPINRAIGFPTATEDAVKEYRDEAMKHLEAAEHALPAELGEAAYKLNAAIASSLVDIAETLHAIRASLDKQIELAR